MLDGVWKNNLGVVARLEHVEEYRLGTLPMVRGIVHLLEGRVFVGTFDSVLPKRDVTLKVEKIKGMPFDSSECYRFEGVLIYRRTDVWESGIIRYN